MPRRIVMLAACIVLFLLPPYARTLIESRSALESARAAQGEGRSVEAIEWYRKAISWGSPGNSAAHEAQEALGALARSNLSPELKERAFRELKRGLRSSRSFLNPRGESDVLIQEIEREIAAVTKAPRVIEEVHPPNLNYRFQALSHLAFWGWILSAIAAIWRGVTPQGGVIRAPLLKGLGVSSVCYVLWLVALANA